MNVVNWGGIWSNVGVGVSLVDFYSDLIGVFGSFIVFFLLFQG